MLGTQTSQGGNKPATGTTTTNAAKPVNAPLHGAPGQRDAATYDQVIDQFGVETNPRYTPRDSDGNGTRDTFCNIFMWDVTSAMGAEIPHWVDAQNNPAKPGHGNRELNANAAVGWLSSYGSKHGWREVSQDTAQAQANKGHPTVVVWKNTGGIGHVAVVRPGQVTDKGATIAQAGASNYNVTHVRSTFPKSATLKFWTHEGQGRGSVVSAPVQPSTPKPEPTPVKKPAARPVADVRLEGVPQSNLRMGANGPEVKQLQDVLVMLGYMTKEQVATGPGHFGSKTEAAVQRFQADHGIAPSSGLYGSRSRAALTQALTALAEVPAPSLRVGDNNAEVLRLQEALVRVRYMTEAQVATGPGRFGPKTEAAVQRFQREHDIQPASGLYGPRTYTALCAAVVGRQAASVPVAGPETHVPASPVPQVSSSAASTLKVAKLEKLLHESGLRGQEAHLLAMSTKYNVPVELALAMFKMESAWNTTGRAVKNHNPGNLRFADWEKAYGAVKHEGYTRFPSLAHGIEAYFCLLDRPLYRTFVNNRDWRGLIYKYAPPSDNNDSEHYFQVVAMLVTKYQAKLSV